MTVQIVDETHLQDFADRAGCRPCGKPHRRLSVRCAAETARLSAGRLAPERELIGGQRR